jgi:DNA-binding NarL/FixJ family response regulator
MSRTAHTTALIADDHGLYRSGLALLLKDVVGFAEVIEAGSFDAALDQLAARADVALALFDLSMPGMGGPASLGVVRECYPQVRVAVVSASEARSDVLESLGAGVHGYIAKSLGDQDIAAAISTICAGEIYTPRFIATAQAAWPPRHAQPGAARDQERRAAAVLARLTPRQKDVFDLVAQGLSNKEIARQLEIAEGTVKIHLAALFGHLGVKNRAQAAALAARLEPR